MKSRETQTFPRPGYLDGRFSSRDDHCAHAEPLLDARVQVLAAVDGLVHYEVGSGAIVVSVGENVKASVAVVDVDERDRMRGGGIELVLDWLGIAVTCRDKAEDLPALEFHGVVAMKRLSVRRDIFG